MRNQRLAQYFRELEEIAMTNPTLARQKEIEDLSHFANPNTMFSDAPISDTWNQSSVMYLNGKLYDAYGFEIIEEPDTDVETNDFQ